MGQLFSSSFPNNGLIMNRSSQPIVYEIEGPWQQITEDILNKEVNPKFKKLAVGYQVEIGQLYKRGKVISHAGNKVVVEVAPGEFSVQGLYKVEYGKTRISVRASLKEGDYIIQNDVINTKEAMRICVEDNRKHHGIKKQTVKKLMQSQTQTAALGQVEAEFDQDDLAFLKALTGQGENKEL